MDDLFGSWLCGFIDGEASFYISRKPNKFSCSYENVFSLALRADDVDILNDIKKEIGFGEIYYKECKLPTNPQFFLKIADIKNCCKLVDIIDKYGLKTKKRLDYNIWKKCLLYRRDNKYGYNLYTKERVTNYNNALESFYLDIKKIREFHKEKRGSKL